MRRFLIRAVLLVLLAPTALVLLYRFVDPPVTPLMLIRSAEGEPLHYRPVPLDHISSHLIAAVIASEDNLFCRHMGFDLDALRTEVSNWIDGERPRGASTISMQTAKNILLWPDRDLLRKGLEAWFTPQLELLWDKRRIIEVYLNVAEMGPGIYGAEAYNVVVDDALRLTNSGTFIHAAPWNGSLGEANLSHGCINASSEDAQWMMDFSYIGDPVEISNTPERLAPDNGWGVWNLTAEQWLAEATP